eukprot:COSAG01_NODE_70024_length_259_cov_2.787500_1_plen_60_part_10
MSGDTVGPPRPDNHQKFPTPVRPLPVASAGMSLPLRLLALVAVAVWPSAMEAQGTESVVA